MFLEWALFCFALQRFHWRERSESGLYRPLEMKAPGKARERTQSGVLISCNTLLGVLALYVCMKVSPSISQEGRVESV